MPTRDYRNLLRSCRTNKRLHPRNNLVYIDCNNMTYCTSKYLPIYGVSDSQHNCNFYLLDLKTSNLPYHSLSKPRQSWSVQFKRNMSRAPIEVNRFTVSPTIRLVRTTTSIYAAAGFQTFAWTLRWTDPLQPRGTFVSARYGRPNSSRSSGLDGDYIYSEYP